MLSSSIKILRAAIVLAGMILTGRALGAEVVECVSHYAKPLAQCTVTSSRTGGPLTIRSNVLSEGRIYEGGVLRVNARGRIDRIGCPQEPMGSDVIDCPGSVVTAGLINLHEHLYYSSGKPLPPPVKPFVSHVQWQRAPSLWGGKRIPRTGNKQVLSLVELRHLLSGTTSLAGRGKFNGLARNLDKGWFAPVTNITFPFGRHLQKLSSDCAKQRILSEHRPTLVHAGEGTDKDARRELACLLDSREAYGQHAPLTIVHAIAVDDALATRMASLGVSMLWSPHSNEVLYGATAPIDVLLRHGVRISLGTDWLPSGSPTLLDEARFARRVGGDTLLLTDDQLLNMMTINPAEAVGMEGQLGTLRKGARADIAAFKLHDITHPERDILLSRIHDTSFVIVGGTLQFANRDVVPEAAELMAHRGCAELPKLACLPEGYVCGSGTLRRALRRPDAARILCPVMPAIENGTWPASVERCERGTKHSNGKQCQ